MRLNVGCGEFKAPGWTNMDTQQIVYPDLIGSLTSLPPEVQNVEAVYLGHVLEHIPYWNLEGSLRKLWTRCVQGARVAVVGPDVLIAWALAIHGRMTEEEAVGATMGGRRWPGDEHRWPCEPRRLRRLLVTSGLDDVQRCDIKSTALNEFPVTSRAPWQCAFIGRVS